MKDKKILIVGAGDFQLPIVKAAARRGSVVLAAPAVPEELLAYVDKICIADVRDKEKILAFARQERIDAVQTDQTDLPVRTVAYVAEQMGLPGNSYQTARLFSEKNLMRDRMKELGLPLLPYRVIHTLEEAKAFYKELSAAPVIVKPMGTQGSRGVVEITKEEEIEDAFALAMKFSDDGNILIEKCAHGIEFVMETAVVNGVCTDLILGDTHYFSKKSLFSAKERIFPSVESEEICQKIRELNRAIVEGFGLKQGVTHGEYIVDDGQPYLLEIAARGGGVFISSDLIHLRTGLETEEFLLDLALTGQAEPVVKETGVFCGYRAFYLPAGTVESIEGIEYVKALPYVHSTQLHHLAEGMHVEESSNKTSRIALIVSAADYDEWQRNVEHIRDHLHVMVRNANGDLEDIIWD